MNSISGSVEKGIVVKNKVSGKRIVFKNNKLKIGFKTIKNLPDEFEYTIVWYGANDVERKSLKRLFNVYLNNKLIAFDSNGKIFLQSKDFKNIGKRK